MGNPTDSAGRDHDPSMEDVHTIPELGVEIRELRRELRGYVQGHDREHVRMMDESTRAHQMMTADVHTIRNELLPAVRANTEWRLTRLGQEQLIKWLVGSNAAVLAGLGISLVALLLHGSS